MIAFNPHLKFNDGVLAKVIAEKEGTDEQAAQNQVAKFVREIEAELGKGNSYDMFAFGNFFKDMGERPKGLTLERVDNNKGYSKENCRWATPAEQNRNMHSNVITEYEGIRYCLTDLAAVLGIPRSRLEYHYCKGLRDNELIKQARIGDLQ